jgi:uncharacterized membrane protein YgaE (UPF0421/DUF939 family)
MATMPAEIVARARRALARVGPRDLWPLAQATAAAAAAWLIAKDILDHPEPFFAPISALVSLNTSVGERGLNALRLLQGVVLGIGAAELTLFVIGGGYGSLALATFLALVLGQAFGRARIVIAQAAASAILTVAVANGEVGYQRLTDALVGAGVALVFSQVLFSPEPLRLLRRAETALLARMADGLALTARSLANDDDELAERAIDELRALPDEVADLRRTRRASARVSRRTLVWRSRRALVVQENENADHLDLLGSSCLVVARVATSLTGEERRTLEQPVGELADVLVSLAGDLGDRETRQRAADRAFEVATAVDGRDVAPGSTPAAGVVALRMLAIDLMVFAGVDLDVAAEAVRAGALEQQVPTPPPPPRGLLGWLRSLRRRK